MSQPSSSPTFSRCQRLVVDQRGALLLEYVVVTMAGLVIATALAGLGVELVKGFGNSLQTLYSEYP